MSPSTILLIARREMNGYLRTWTGYIIIAAALLITGLFFQVDALAGEKKSAEVLAKFFFWANGVGAIGMLFLAMRSLAEERQIGTITLLYSSPVRDAEIVLGKYLAGLGFMVVLLASTAYMPALVAVHGKISFGHIAAGYLGMTLFGAAALAIGVFSSSLTKSPILSLVISAAITIALVVAWMLARITERPLSDVFNALSMHGGHFQPFQSGVVTLRNCAYYLMVCYVFLFGATRVVEARRWR
jgi:ABC-2 type transport system permease protein